MPAHPPILTLGFSEAAMFLRSPSAPTIAALLSIHGPHEFPLQHRAPSNDSLSSTNPDSKLFDFIPTQNAKYAPTRE